MSVMMNCLISAIYLVAIAIVQMESLRIVSRDIWGARPPKLVESIDINVVGMILATGDGQVYQGRGFNVVGAHTQRFNNKSIGICLIGDWQSSFPPENMLKATQDLIAYAIEKEKLSENYTLLGHRQTRNTLCPGEFLFQEISKWPHFEINYPVFSNEIET